MMKGSEDDDGWPSNWKRRWRLVVENPASLASPYIRLQKLRYDQAYPWELYTGTLDRFLMSDACISGHHPNTHIKVAPRSGEQLAGMRLNGASSIRERGKPDPVVYNVDTALTYAVGGPESSKA